MQHDIPVWQTCAIARPFRIEFPGAAYYVTSRGNARQKIYSYAAVSRIIKAIEEIS